MTAWPANTRYGPAYDPTALRTGVLHLGLGAFHRAHQAVYLDDLAAAGHTDWGICAVAPHSHAVVAALRRQDHRYTVATRAGDRPVPRVVGSIREAVHAPSQDATVLARLADPRTRLVTLTITEKAYTTAGPGTIPDLLVRGLAARHAAGGAPLTVLSCDNLLDNGHRLRDLVLSTVEDRPALSRWIGDTVAFPRSVVDRIVPATTPADAVEVRDVLGVTDDACVLAERYRSWVVEAVDAPGQPPWQDAGVLVTGELDAHQQLKLRVLNATHSLLAYLGLAAGATTIAQTMAVPELRAAARALLDDEVLPTLPAPSGVDTHGYADEVLVRFADPALRHTTAQVGTDGSTKLPQRFSATLHALLARGGAPRLSALALAGWLHALRTGAAGVTDPASATVRENLAVPPDSASVGATLAGVLDRDLARHPTLTGLVTEHLRALDRGANVAAHRALHLPEDR